VVGKWPVPRGKAAADDPAASADSRGGAERTVGAERARDDCSPAGRAGWWIRGVGPVEW